MLQQGEGEEGDAVGDEVVDEAGEEAAVCKVDGLLVVVVEIEARVDPEEVAKVVVEEDEAVIDIYKYMITVNSNKFKTEIVLTVNTLMNRYGDGKDKTESHYVTILIVKYMYIVIFCHSELCTHIALLIAMA